VTQRHGPLAERVGSAWCRGDIHGARKSLCARKSLGAPSTSVLLPQEEGSVSFRIGHYSPELQSWVVFATQGFLPCQNGSLLAPAIRQAASDVQ